MTDVVAALIAGAAAPLLVLVVFASVGHWRSLRLARRELALQRQREARRQERSRTRSRRNQAATGHASLDWLRPSLDDREATTPAEAGAMLRHVDPAVYGPRRVCRACGHNNRIAAYYCARCSARLRR